LEEVLKWLVFYGPEACMEIIESLSSSIKPSIEIIVQIYEQYPNSLLAYLERRIFSLESLDLHQRMFLLYFNVILNEPVSTAISKGYRLKFRYFIIFSKYYDKDVSDNCLSNYPAQFLNEIILLRTNAENAEESLQYFITENSSTFDIATAELLCTRYPSPNMLRLMLDFYLRVSRTNSTIRASIPNILKLLDNAAPLKEVLQYVPDELSLRHLINSFISRSLFHSLHIVSCSKIRQALAQKALAHCDAEKITANASQVSIIVNEESVCVHCSEMLDLGVLENCKLNECI